MVIKSQRPHKIYENEMLTCTPKNYRLGNLLLCWTRAVSSVTISPSQILRVERAGYSEVWVQYAGVRHPTRQDGRRYGDRELRVAGKSQDWVCHTMGDLHTHTSLGRDQTELCYIHYCLSESGIGIWQYHIMPLTKCSHSFPCQSIWH